MYSEELIETVRRNKAIQHVHFTASGEHFFNVYNHRDGNVYGRLIDGVPDLKTKIADTVYRDKILLEEREENVQPKRKRA